MSDPGLADDPWYPEQYWVPDAQAPIYPFRYGDLFRSPPADAFGRSLISQGEKPTPWLGVLVLSPSCDLVSKADDDGLITVARMKSLTRQSAAQQAQVVAGSKPTEQGSHA